MTILPPAETFTRSAMYLLSGVKLIVRTVKPVKKNLSVILMVLENMHTETPVWMNVKKAFQAYQYHPAAEA